MTREEFIKVLDKEGYSYKIEGDKIVVTYRGLVDLSTSETLPPGVEFNNGGIVYLDSLETLPPDVEFMNKGNVHLDSLETLPPDVKFMNKGYVNLNSLKTLHPDVKFNNEGSVFLRSLKTIHPSVEFNNKGYDVDLRSLTGDYFSEWSGLIKGIAPNRLLNGMIKRGLFL